TGGAPRGKRKPPGPQTENESEPIPPRKASRAYLTVRRAAKWPGRDRFPHRSVPAASADRHVETQTAWLPPWCPKQPPTRLSSEIVHLHASPDALRLPQQQSRQKRRESVPRQNGARQHCRRVEAISH